MPPRKRQRTGGGKTLPKLMRERFVRWYLKLRADGDLTSKTACVERAAEAYGIANSTAWDLVGKHEAGGLEALTPAKAGGANNQIIDTSVLPMLLLRFERTAEHERTAHLEVFCDSGAPRGAPTRRCGGDGQRGHPPPQQQQQQQQQQAQSAFGNAHETTALHALLQLGKGTAGGEAV